MKTAYHARRPFYVFEVFRETPYPDGTTAVIAFPMVLCVLSVTTTLHVLFRAFEYADLIVFPVVDKILNYLERTR